MIRDTLDFIFFLGGHINLTEFYKIIASLSHLVSSPCRPLDNTLTKRVLLVVLGALINYMPKQSIATNCLCNL